MVRSSIEQRIERIANHIAKKDYNSLLPDARRLLSDIEDKWFDYGDPVAHSDLKKSAEALYEQLPALAMDLLAALTTKGKFDAKTLEACALVFDSYGRSVDVAAHYGFVLAPEDHKRNTAQLKATHQLVERLFCYAEEQLFPVNPTQDSLSEASLSLDLSRISLENARLEHAIEETAYQISDVLPLARQYG